MKHTFILLLFSVLMLNGSTGYSGNCSDKSGDICVAESPWLEANAAALGVTEPGSDNYSNWRFIFSDQHNLSIEKDEKYNGKRSKGTIMLVGGQMLFAKGLTIKEGSETEEIDGAILMYQLVIDLLDQAISGGPDSVKGKIKIRHKEKKRGIKTMTPSASGYFAAPWEITGVVEREDDELINYSFTFKFSEEKKTRTLKLKGYWIKSKKRALFSDKMDIKGIKIYSIGSGLVKQTFKTLGDLRKYIEAQSQ